MGKLFSFYGDDFGEDTLFPNVSDLLHHEKYLLRITGIHILMVETSRRNEEQGVGKQMKPEMVSTRVLNLLNEVKDDVVANVRLNVAKALRQLKNGFTEDVIKSTVQFEVFFNFQVIPILQKYQQDSDCDVRYFASVALEDLR